MSDFCGLIEWSCSRRPWFPGRTIVRHLPQTFRPGWKIETCMLKRRSNFRKPCCLLCTRAAAREINFDAVGKYYPVDRNNEAELSAVSKDGMWMAVSFSGMSIIRLFKFDGDRRRNSFTIKIHSGNVTGLDFCPSPGMEHLLLSSSDDGTVGLSCVQIGELFSKKFQIHTLVELAGPKGEFVGLSCCKFIECGSTFFLGSTFGHLIMCKLQPQVRSNRQLSLQLRDNFEVTAKVVSTIHSPVVSINLGAKLSETMASCFESASMTFTGEDGASQVVSVPLGLEQDFFLPTAELLLPSDCDNLTANLDPMTPAATNRPSALSLEGKGGLQVVQLVAAWDALAARISATNGVSSAVNGLVDSDSTSSSSRAKSGQTQLLLSALKVTLMALQMHEQGDISVVGNSRKALDRALSVASILADLGMDAETIAAGLVREAVQAGCLSLVQVEDLLGEAVTTLVLDWQRIQAATMGLDSFEDSQLREFRRLCLSLSEGRALILQLALCVDSLRQLGTLPRWHQQVLALESLQLWSPLAHAVGCASMLWEMEDTSFWVLFPHSYEAMAEWISTRFNWQGAGTVGREALLETVRQRVETTLGACSAIVKELQCRVSVRGRCKSLYSAMRKVVKDGRGREEVHDLMGLRVVVSPLQSEGSDPEEAERRAVQACYICQDVIEGLWPAVPGRTKDYIVRPKGNQYQSLHLTVSVSLDAREEKQSSVPFEVQIRTAAMDELAEHGVASHAAYKGGLTDAYEVTQLRAIVHAIADMAKEEGPERSGRVNKEGPALLPAGRGKQHLGSMALDGLFHMFDANGDGQVSLAEIQAVMAELSPEEAEGGDAQELMAFLDADGDGSVSVEEFRQFLNKVRLLVDLPGVDKEYEEKLGLRLPMEAPSQVESETAAAEAPLPAQEQQEQPGTSGGQLWTEGRANYVDLDSLREESDSGSGSDSDFFSSYSSRGASVLARRPVAPSSFSILQSAFGEGSGGGESDRESMFEESQEVVEAKERVNLTQELKELRLLMGKGKDSKRGRDSWNAHGNWQMRMSAARGKMEKLVSLHPLEPEVWVHYAQLERKAGNVSSALSRYEQSVQCFEFWREDSPAHVRALHAWATLENQRGNARQARSLFRKALRLGQAILRSLEDGSAATVLDPEDCVSACVVVLHSWSSLELRHTSGSWEKARALLMEAESLQPNNVIVLQSRALLEKRAHNWEEARRYFRRATENASGVDPVPWQAWAVMESERGRVKKMRWLFEKALQADPDNVHTLQAWACAESKIEGKEAADQARDLYQKTTKCMPASVHAWQAWAVFEHKQGNVEAARKLFTRALQLGPTNVACIQAFALFEKGNGSLDEAKRLCWKAMELEPNNPAVLMAAAQIERELGNEESAVNLFIKAAMADRKKSRQRRAMFHQRKKIKDSATKPHLV